MDLAKSFRKFFNYKRHYVVKELRSGKLKMAIGPCVIDEENEIYDESIHTDYINIRYSVRVNCYSAKEAVEIAAQRIQADKEIKKRERDRQKLELATEADERASARLEANARFQAIITAANEHFDTITAESNTTFAELRAEVIDAYYEEQQEEYQCGKRQLVVKKV